MSSCALSYNKHDMIVIDDCNQCDLHHITIVIGDNRGINYDRSSVTRMTQQ